MSSRDTIADDECYAEIGGGVARVDSPRRWWNEAEKRRIVMESDRSGESASTEARCHDVHASVLFRWRRRYGPLAPRGR